MSSAKKIGLFACTGAPTKKTLFEFTRLAIVGRFLYLYLPEYCLF